MLRKISDDLYYVGASDRRLALFESVYPIPRGVSYNAYILKDEKTVLLDTTDPSVADDFFANVEEALGDRTLDYILVSHLEPDHAGTLGDAIRRYPNAAVILNAKSKAMLEQFLGKHMPQNILLVKEGDTLCTGAHTLAFVMAPMVHWPEVMVSFDVTTGTLFSADAFGTFGALSGNLFADEVAFERDWLADARRYYTNIVGKYGTQVKALLKKAAGLEIRCICPLHGPIWRADINWFISKYIKWAHYEPEENGVVIAYASVYGNTERAAGLLAAKLAARGIRDVRMYDVSVTHASEIIAEAFRVSHLVFASTTYNAGIFVNMENLLHDLAAHNLQKRTIAFIENGSWAPTSGSLMRSILEPLSGMTVLDQSVTIKSAVSEQNERELDVLADAIYETFPKRTIVHEAKVAPTAFFKLSYGLFVLTARDRNKDNGCIINTVTQVTDSPKRIQIAVNKANLTCEMIRHTGIFNVSILSTSAPFEVFRHFGFQSGRDTDKFADCEDVRADNGIRYIPHHTNAFISAAVTNMQDLGTHIVFTADVTQAETLTNDPSMTYAYYFDRVKPKPVPAEEKPHGWVCSICGYVYEDDDLPADFVCPLCKHGTEAFEKLG